MALIEVNESEAPELFEAAEACEITFDNRSDERVIAEFIASAPHSSLLRIADEMRASPVARRRLRELAACLN